MRIVVMRSDDDTNKIREVIMVTITSTRNSEFEMICEKCGEALIAPEWSEYVSERLVLNLWSCTNCGNRFETEAFVLADTESESDNKVFEEFFSALLVA
jgi:uncharacterized protein with PIN domain